MVRYQLQAIIDILNGKDPEQRKMWCIDTEFSYFHLVCEMAVVDCQSNNAVLDTLVKHSPELSRVLFTPQLVRLLQRPEVRFIRFLLELWS